MNSAAFFKNLILGPIPFYGYVLNTVTTLTGETFNNQDDLRNLTTPNLQNQHYTPHRSWKKITHDSVSTLQQPQPSDKSIINLYTPH